MTLVTTATGTLAFTAVSVALGFAFHSTIPAVDTYLLGSLPDADRASAYAVYSGLMMVVQAMGSSVVGVLADAGVGYDAIFGGVLVLPLVVLISLLVLYADGRVPAGARA